MQVHLHTDQKLLYLCIMNTLCDTIDYQVVLSKHGHIKSDWLNLDNLKAKTFAFAPIQCDRSSSLDKLKLEWASSTTSICMNTEEMFSWEIWQLQEISQP